MHLILVEHTQKEIIYFKIFFQAFLVERIVLIIKRLTRLNVMVNNKIDGKITNTNIKKLSHLMSNLES